MYKINKNEPLKSAPFLTWSQVSGLKNEFSTPESLDRRKDLTGIHLVFSVGNYQPMTIPGRDLRGPSSTQEQIEIFLFLDENGSFYGISISLVENLRYELNFTYEIVGSPDGEWGVRRNDGSWTGFVGKKGLRMYWDVRGIVFDFPRTIDVRGS